MNSCSLLACFSIYLSQCVCVSVSKFNDEYVVCLSANSCFQIPAECYDFCCCCCCCCTVNFYGTMEIRDCIHGIILAHPSSLCKSFDVANMVRIHVFNNLPAASVKKKTQLIDLYSKPNSIWEKSWWKLRC